MNHSEAVQQTTVIGALVAVLFTAALMVQSIATLNEAPQAATQTRTVASLK